MIELGDIWYPTRAEESGVTREQYFSAIWFIRDYDNMVREAQDLLDQSPIHDGQPRGTHTSDPTAEAAERRERVLRDIKCIEDAFDIVPDEFKKPLYENLVHRVPEYKLSLNPNDIRKKHPDAINNAETTIQYWRVKLVVAVIRNRERAEWRSY